MFEELLRRLPDIELAGPVRAAALELHQRHQAHAGDVHARLNVTRDLRESRGML